MWRRLKLLGAAGGAAGAVGIGRHPAGLATKAAGKALWLWAIQWGAVVAVGVPSAGAATYWALHRPSPVAHTAVVTAESTPSSPAADVLAPVDRGVPSSPAATSLVEPPSREPPKVVSPSNAGARAGTRTESSPPQASSALKVESQLLAGARTKLAAGDASGALDDITRLSAQFPRGRLVQEREVVAIDCLAALGDRQGLRARALAFRARFPDSPYSAHVREVLSARVPQ